LDNYASFVRSQQNPYPLGKAYLPEPLRTAEIARPGGEFFGPFLTPVFYLLIRGLEKRVTGTDAVHQHA